MEGGTKEDVVIGKVEKLESSVWGVVDRRSDVRAWILWVFFPRGTLFAR